MDFSMNNLFRFFEDALDWAIKNKTIVFAGVAGVAVLGSGLALHSYLTTQKSMSAHKALVALSALAQEPVRIAGKEALELKETLEQQKWERVATKAQQEFEEFKSTKMAGAFLAIAADALMTQNKTKEAVVAMKKAVEAMQAPAVKDYYQLKLALMLMDQHDDQAKAEGLDLLQKMANDQKNVAHDRALYYLGEHCWIKRDFAGAKNYFQQMVVKYGGEKGSSEFVDKAKEKLELLAV